MVRQEVQGLVHKPQRAGSSPELRDMRSMHLAGGQSLDTLAHATPAMPRTCPYMLPTCTSATETLPHSQSTHLEPELCTHRSAAQ